MLTVLDIKKKSTLGEHEHIALNGLNINFRKQEFVAIVGPSGCGKTTALNIIGGLDRYDAGCLMINGEDTRGFKEAQWDAYRNNSIGFIFQNYNLITHISVLDNVEVGMTLSGLSAQERKKQAIEVLKRVGLKDHLHKRPNQLSGGQMQRVAIARALANNPDIILADEPTGALDSQTSEQIMQLIKEISKDKLVIMVTHDVDIANRYASRLIKLRDGVVIEDSNPIVKDQKETTRYQFKKTAMHYLQALKLSFNNLKTKKFRTLITAFAGSIGIIGIALILALSNGLNREISKMQTSTLADYPISITRNPMMVSRQRVNQHERFPNHRQIIAQNRDDTRQHINEITSEYLNYLKGMDSSWYSEISFQRAVNMNLLKRSDGNTVIVNNRQVRWNELPNNSEFFMNHYNILEGHYPRNKNELLLIVDIYNGLDLSILTALGFSLERNLTFDDLLGMELKLVLNDDFYQKGNENGLFNTNPNLNAMYESEDSITLTITGIARMKEGTQIRTYNPGIMYLPTLTDFVLEDAIESKIAIAQEESDINVLTGVLLTPRQKEDLLRHFGAVKLPAAINIYPTDFASKELIKSYLSEYNERVSEEDQIIYNDMAELVTNMMGEFINTISYVLIGFSSISLFVSSIMIGIITYVSVLERTKEIGILRSLGARKKDISRVFNAETIIIGFTAGILGVIIAWVLTHPINFLISRFVEGVDSIAILSFMNIIILILISMILTFISGMIPASMAAKKNPVEALRTD